MALRAGDIAPNPELEGEEGPNPIYSRSDRSLILLLFGDVDQPQPPRWREVIDQAEASDGEISVYRVLPSAKGSQPGVLLDPQCEAHRRYDAYDWNEMRPLAAVAAIGQGGMLRFTTDRPENGLSPLFKIMDAHLSRVRIRKRA